MAKTTAGQALTNVRGHVHNFTSSAGKDEHYFAIAVPARVVRLTPESWLDRTTWRVGLLGCPVKENHVNYTSCGKGWTMSEGRCYQKFASPLVWWAAERYCQSLGGHLAAVNTPQENEFIRDNIGNGWIGMKIGAVLIKKEREKIVNFTWSDGSPAGDAFREQDISFDGFPEYILRLNDPFCAFLEDHGPWSLQPCSLIEKEFICEKGAINVDKCPCIRHPSVSMTVKLPQPILS
ncbi:brevican core protein-like [Branchiostoma floridae]|uniref:Brevican core protein-like n=1 Tax=Branchiostoma floridae TaxID=7739 RepID=A0A9J7NB49_BRAFL|nr:brevican core protein-like [Branchiostoma floridae]